MRTFLSSATLVMALLTTAHLAHSAQIRIVEMHTNTADVRDLAIYAGAVWAATGGGLVAYDVHTGEERLRIMSTHGLPGNSLRSLAVQNDTLLVGGDFGLAEVRLARLDAPPTVRVFKLWSDRYDPVFEILPGSSVEFVQMQGGLRDLRDRHETPMPAMGKAWSSAARGLDGHLLGALDGTLAFLPTDRVHEPSQFALSEPVLDILSEDSGFLVATGRELLRFEHSRVRSLFLRDDTGRPVDVPATTITRDASSRTWIGTADGRLLSIENGEPVVKRDGLPGRLTSIAAYGDTLWLGTPDSGTYWIEGSAPPRAVRRQGEICGNHVARLAVHRDVLVVATFDSGACAFVDGLWKDLAGLPSEFVLSLASDGNELWVGTSNGLRRFDAVLEPIALPPDAPALLRDMERLASTAIVSLGPGEWAVSYLHGVAHVRRSEPRQVFELLKVRDGIPKHRTSLGVLGSRLVIGSETEGAVVFDLHTKKAKRYLDPVHLPEAWVMDVSADNKTLWVGTCQNGVAKLQGETATFVSTEQGLPDDHVIAVAAEASGSAYVATLGGLAHIDARGAIRSFTLADHLPDPRGSALLLSPDGVWLGTESGLAFLSVH